MPPLNNRNEDGVSHWLELSTAIFYQVLGCSKWRCLRQFRVINIVRREEEFQKPNVNILSIAKTKLESFRSP